jgi:DeoR family fructose operon transcriptional repressor
MSDSHISPSAKSAGKRQSDVLLHIREKGTATIATMAERFEISEMTVRRILQRLSELGLVIRTHGGAMIAPGGSMEKTFVDRSKKMASAKNALGRAAASLVQDGETVVLDSGTTTQCIARHLSGRSNLVVVTASLAVLEELAPIAGIQVRLTGGTYRRMSHDLCGSAVDETLENIYADRVFFGAATLSFRKGAMNFDSEMPKSMLQAGKQKVLVIDSSKIGMEAVYRFCGIEECDLVITDRGIKSDDLQRLRKLTKVLVAD